MTKSEAFIELERGVQAALETYSNVHRGSGHNSIVTTHLYEKARNIVMEYLGLSKSKYVVIFCSPRGATALIEKLKSVSFQSVSSKDIGLSLGVRAVAVERKALPKGTPFQTGGGTTRLISYNWIIWASAPDKFEAGTPSIINIIAFARALQMVRQSGNEIFLNPITEKSSVNEILYHDELEKYSGKELLDHLRSTLIGRNILVPTIEGHKPYINFDNGASTPTFSPVWNAVLRAWQQSGNLQKEIIHEVRSICSDFLGAPAGKYDLVFTLNTTEAINILAESYSREQEPETEHVFINTLLEHSSNDLPWRMVPNSSLIRLSIDNEGFIKLNDLKDLLISYNEKRQYGKKRIRLVAVSGASNVLGVYNNLAEISQIVHQYGASLLVDAAQMVAHRKVDIEGCGIDYFVFSAHKVYAPFGCGVLVVKKGLLNLSSSELELIRISGEENAGGIAALGKALVLLQRIGIDLIRDEEQALTRRVLEGLSQLENISVYGIKNPDSPEFAKKGGVIVFSIKGIMAESVAKELAKLGGIGVRSGCHCAHILVKHLLNVGPGLERFQRFVFTLVPGITPPGIVRVSLGIGNTEEEVDTLIRVLKSIAGKHVFPKLNMKLQMKDIYMAASQRVYGQLQ